MTELSPVEALFFAALEKPEAERAAYLETACPGDADLRRRVERMLAAHPRVGRFLEPPPRDDTATGDPEPQTADHPGPGEVAGAVIAGRYRLLETVGEGGMGTVWMAQQTEPVKRLVALKLIKAGMDSKAVLARFDAERQALAVMDHPNIAKVFDGGLTPDGQPFFAMELVKGVPITRFCDQRKLTPRQRLELFVPVCQAIQHAHQKGVIHRDIKPCNVLVELHDDKPVPKVIDFGLAKAAGQPLTDATLHTEVGAVVGTPEYMSPEQASFDSLDIDTRSDVYGLGVLLYELLAGSPPFRSAELRQAGLLEILRVVREVEPPRPSAKLSTSDSRPSIAADRGTEPAALTGLLRNELDWVVMKAIEKDRTRRYETANGLAADVQRYLAGEPVAAHPPSSAYRLRKFLRRHRGPAVAAGVVAATLVAGIAGTTWGMLRAAAARRDEAAQRTAAVAERDRATEKEAETRAVLEFVETRVFAAARPEEEAGGLGREVTLRKAVEAAVPFVEARFKNQPLVEARLRTTLGQSFLYLGDAAAAEQQCRTALALRVAKLGPDHPDTLQSMINLAAGYRVLGRPQEAMTVQRETLRLQKTRLGPDHPDTLITMNNLANSYGDLGREQEAVALREEVLRLRKARLGPDHPDTLSSMNNLAASYHVLRRPAEALALNEEALRLRKARLGPDHPDTLRSMHNLAAGYSALGRLREAVALWEEVRQPMKARLGADHPDTLQSMASLAVGYRVLGRDAEALALNEEALRLRKAKLGADHPDTLQSMFTVADSLSRLDRHGEAAPVIDDCLKRALGRAVKPKWILMLFGLRVQSFERAKDAAGCRETARMWEDLKRADADSLYNAACMRAVAAAVGRAADPSPAGAEQAAADADRAMEWLRKAVAAGYKDAAHMAQDKDLDALRGREDFRKLMESLPKP